MHASGTTKSDDVGPPGERWNARPRAIVSSVAKVSDEATAIEREGTPCGLKVRMIKCAAVVAGHSACQSHHWEVGPCSSWKLTPRRTAVLHPPDLRLLLLRYKGQSGEDAAEKGHSGYLDATHQPSTVKDGSGSIHSHYGGSIGACLRCSSDCPLTDGIQRRSKLASTNGQVITRRTVIRPPRN